MNFQYDPQGWNSDDPIFNKIITEIKPATIIEVGTWKGASALHMSRICKDQGIKTKIYCVDTWLGSTEHLLGLNREDLKPHLGYPQLYYQFLANVEHEGFTDVIVPVPNTSLNAARYFQKAGIKANLVYIDASHEYEDVLSDLRAYWPLVLDRGALIGDDYRFGDGRDCWEGVTRAVDRFASENGLSFERSGCKYLFRKKVIA